MLFIRLLIVIKKTWKRNTFQTTGTICYGTEYYINIKSQNLEKYLITWGNAHSIFSVKKQIYKTPCIL